MTVRFRLFNLSILFVSLFVGLFICEMALRLYVTHDYFTWSPNMREIFRPSPDVMPGIEGDSRFETNDWGIRGREFSTARQFRILTIGGSTTECLYLDQSETWPNLLEEALNEKFGHDTIWVGNIGKSGINTDHHVVQIEKVIEDLPRIDMFIVLIGANDFLRRLGLDKDYFSIDRQSRKYQIEIINESFSFRPGWDDETYPFYKRTEVWRLLRKVKNRLFPAEIPPDIAPAVQDEAGLIYDKWREHRRLAGNIREQLPEMESALGEYKQNIHKMVQLAKSKDISIVFLTQPSLWADNLPDDLRNLLWLGGVGEYKENIGNDYYSSGKLSEGMQLYNEQLLDICVNSNLYCFDLAKYLPKDTSVFYDDLHFNENGAIKIAPLVENFLLKEGLLTNPQKQ